MAKKQGATTNARGNSKPHTIIEKSSMVDIQFTKARKTSISMQPYGVRELKFSRNKVPMLDNVCKSDESETKIIV